MMALILPVEKTSRLKNGAVRDFGGHGIVDEGSGPGGHKIIDVSVLNNDSNGIHIISDNNQVRGCTAQSNGLDFAINVGTGSLLIHNTAAENAGLGIRGGFGSTMMNNTAYSNGLDGITSVEGLGFLGSTMSNNTAYSNGRDGIVGGAGSTMTNNTAYNNAAWGIQGLGSNLIEGNTVYRNNASESANVGGLRVYSDSRVVDNTLDDNDQSNIRVTGTGQYSGTQPCNGCDRWCGQWHRLRHLFHIKR